MKIVIVGNGKVGYSLAEQLVREKHDITVVDVREDPLRRAADSLDIMVVRGNGVSADVLREAGVVGADLDEHQGVPVVLEVELELLGLGVGGVLEVLERSDRALLF